MIKRQRKYIQINKIRKGDITTDTGEKQRILRP